MFTGIVEEVGKVAEIESSGENITFSIRCGFFNELKVDQSVAHNGVCLTVTDLDHEAGAYKVTAVRETLLKSNLGELTVGSAVNLERAMKLNGRVDGHLVQGHVDQTVLCIDVTESEGSHIFTFEYDGDHAGLLIEKGSVTINGVSLTVFDVTQNRFSVTIIPYTYAHTTFNSLTEGKCVNIEFDMLGKYVRKQLSLLKKQL